MSIVGLKTFSTTFSTNCTILNRCLDVSQSMLIQINLDLYFFIHQFEFNQSDLQCLAHPIKICSVVPNYMLLLLICHY